MHWLREMLLALPAALPRRLNSESGNACVPQSARGRLALSSVSDSSQYQKV